MCIWANMVESTVTKITIIINNLIDYCIIGYYRNNNRQLNLVITFYIWYYNEITDSSLSEIIKLIKGKII